IGWRGNGVDEIGVIEDIQTSGIDIRVTSVPSPKPPVKGQTVVCIDPRYFRPTEVDFLLGDPTRARTVLGWTPRISFDELVRIMVREDLKEAERDYVICREGFTIYNYFE
ncbi:MAG TPA: GDP-mannose 4,6-dehydratase, partial [Desulfatirhabdiaceae bacterium]|nr:GDP-mannose 4,6-dehydratase [Desulfatirhabdiaceae bacterium]